MTHLLTNFLLYCFEMHYIQILATQLVKLAHQVGLKSEGRTPFTDGARAVGYIDQSGGKLDDATVIISYIE